MWGSDQVGIPDPAADFGSLKPLTLSDLNTISVLFTYETVSSQGFLSLSSQEKIPCHFHLLKRDLNLNPDLDIPFSSSALF